MFCWFMELTWDIVEGKTYGFGCIGNHRAWFTSQQLYCSCQNVHTPCMFDKIHDPQNMVQFMGVNKIAQATFAYEDFPMVPIVQKMCHGLENVNVTNKQTKNLLS